jgi:dTDP-4-dehydrorhamnose 3,5-epimerase
LQKKYSLKLIHQKIPDLILIEPQLHRDDRGYFLETFREDLLKEKIGFDTIFVQDNESKSSKGVLRGLHYQEPPFDQSKLLRVVQGSILDVAVDIRNNSPTFGVHLAIELNEDNKYQLFIPKGFAHGFVVLSNSAIVCYKTDNFYSQESERGILFNDKTLDIDWKLESKDIIVSDKDKLNPIFSPRNKYF